MLHCWVDFRRTLLFSVLYFLLISFPYIKKLISKSDRFFVIINCQTAAEMNDYREYLFTRAIPQSRQTTEQKELHFCKTKFATFNVILHTYIHKNIYIYTE